LEQDFPKEQLDLVLAETFREQGDVIDELYKQILHLPFKHSTTRVLDHWRHRFGHHSSIAVISIVSWVGGETNIRLTLSLQSCQA
jgi:hypothetical protein